MGIGYTKTDIQNKTTKELKALSPVIKECWLDEVDELVSSHRLGDYWLIERELRARDLKAKEIILVNRRTKSSYEFLSLNPHKFMTVKGHSFFECPLRGDEEGLIMKTPDCQLFVTDLYDPTEDELEDVIDNGEFAEYYSTWTH